MDRFVLGYLIVTGALTAVLLVMPQLIILGFAFFVLPGIFFLLAPTAFLWGCAFAACYGIARLALTPLAAACIAAVPAIALLVIIPQPAIRAGEEAAARYRLPAVEPVKPIMPSGDIRLEVGNAGSCGNECVALLFEPGVRSVTVNPVMVFSVAQLQTGKSVLAPSARTFRLLPKGLCGSQEKGAHFYQSPFGITLKDELAIARQWKSRLENDVCVHAEAPMAHCDLLLRTGQIVIANGGKQQRWSLMRRYVGINYGEVRTGRGDILFRNVEPHVEIPTRVLSISPDGNGLDAALGWGRGWYPGNWVSRSNGDIRRLGAALALRRKVN